MNITQKQNILDLIERLKKFDFLGFLKSQGIDDVQTFQYGDIKYSEFAVLFDRMIDQLKFELENVGYRHLPVTFNSQTEFGQIDLVQDLNQLLSLIKQYGNEVHVVNLLDRLIFYQITFGFWDRSSVKVHDIRAVDLKRKISELTVLEEKTNNQKEQVEQDITTINLLIKKLKDGLLVISENETIINNNKIDGENSVLELKRNLEDSNAIKNQIFNINEQVTERLNKISNDINDNSKKFNDIVIQNNLLKDHIEKVIEDSQKVNDKISEFYNYIESQKVQIDKMVGLATDGAIGYKFDQRQKDINRSMLFWKIAVLLSYVVAAIWVGCVFTFFKSSFKDEWLNLTINLIKTTPAWLLVAFLINQYKKEREFEEEYAFKSAVAMTITSYTSLLSNDDISQLKTKDQVLSKVLDNLYSSPVNRSINKNNESLSVQLLSKDNKEKLIEVEGIIRPLIELAKEIKK